MAKEMLKMGSMFRLFVLLSLCEMLSAADLQFNKGEVEVTVSPAEGTAYVDFPFIVTSRKPTHIVAVERSCACITYAPERDSFNPGEQASLRIQIDVSDIVGTVTRKITVKSWSETPTAEEAHPLLVRIQALSPFLPMRPCVTWNIGQSMLTQELTFQVKPEIELEELFVEKTKEDSRLRVVQAVVNENRALSLQFTPLTTGQMQWLPNGENAAIITYKIHFRLKEKGARSKLAYANVLVMGDSTTAVKNK